MKNLKMEEVIARSGIPLLSLRGSQSEPKQSHDRFRTVSAISKKRLPRLRLAMTYKIRGMTIRDGASYE